MYKGNHNDDFVLSRVFDFTKSPQSKQMLSFTKSIEILLAIFIPEIDQYYFWMPVLMYFLFFCSFLYVRSQLSGAVDGLSTSNPNQKGFCWLRACEKEPKASRVKVHTQS